MEGVTAALVGFIFVCIIWPHVIRHRTQFYAAVALVLAIVVLEALTWGFFFRALTGILQACAIFVLILAAGGLTARQLARIFHHFY